MTGDASLCDPHASTRRWSYVSVGMSVQETCTEGGDRAGSIRCELHKGQQCVVAMYVYWPGPITKCGVHESVHGNE